jgi:hypothetical protein
MIRDGDYYPDAISLRVEHDLATPLGALVDAYAAAVRSGLGEITAWDVEGGEAAPGGVDELRAALARPGATTRYVQLIAADGTECTAARYEALGRWEVTVARAERADPPTADWLKRMVGVARDTVGSPGFVRARIERGGPHETDFVPRPPLARGYHLITTTEAEVAARYDDPEPFWRSHDVERLGTLRLCTRGLAELDEHSWLAATFIDTMALARAARPGETIYERPRWDDAFRPWWEPGEYQDERAGFPALRLADYDARGRTLEYAGSASGVLRPGRGQPPAHVLISEIHELRWIALAKKDRHDRPVDTVRVVFADEAMARRERRPLRDVGARVCFRDPSGAAVEVTD